MPLPRILLFMLFVLLGMSSCAHSNNLLLGRVEAKLDLMRSL